MWIHEYVLLYCSFLLSFSLLSNIKFCYFSIKATKTQLIWTIRPNLLLLLWTSSSTAAVFRLVCDACLNLSWGIFLEMVM